MPPSITCRLCAVVLVGAALALTACGDDSGGSTSGAASGGSSGYGAAPATTAAGDAGTTLDLTAQEGDGLSFDKKTLTAKAGKVTIALDNPSGAALQHAVVIEGTSASGESVGPGGTSTATADLKPGSYTFFCPVGNHRAAGMEGTLKVG